MTPINGLIPLSKNQLLAVPELSFGPVHLPQRAEFVATREVIDPRDGAPLELSNFHLAYFHLVGAYDLASSTTGNTYARALVLAGRFES